MINKYIVITIGIFLLNNILIWYQLNSQLVWDWAKGTKSMLVMSLLGIPISMLFWYATKLSYEHFGFTWNMRMIGFGVGPIVFGIMSYLTLKEVPTLKTFICILLAVAIILIQVTNVVDK